MLDRIRNAIANSFGGVWDTLYVLFRIVAYCRFSFIVVAGGLGVLLVTDQGQELTVRLAGDFWGQVFFFVAVCVWAWESWYWSRRILDSRRHTLALMTAPVGGLGRYRNWSADHFPRLLGAVAHLGAFAALLLNGIQFLAWILLVAAVASYGFWYFRRRRLLGKWFHAARGGPLPKALRIARTVNAIVYILLGVLAIAAIFFPVPVGFGLGSAPIAFFGLASLAIVGSAAVYVTSDHGFPVITFLVLVAGLWSVTGWSDNHHVRQTEDKIPPRMVAVSPPGNKSASNTKNAYALWEAQDGLRADDPLVVVATAGGGLRAAYWTATVLGAIQDANAEFHRHLFAISGVSGGSLGSVEFAAALSEKKLKGCGVAQAGTLPNQGCFEAKVQEALSKDFLGPTVTALLYGDLIQRFVPYPLFADRAAVLEGAWESRWKEVFGGSDMLARGFVNYWAAVRRDKNWQPILLLNGTHEETGRRIITSDIRIDTELHRDAIDFFNARTAIGGGKSLQVPFTEMDVRMSTAALNSARFTYVSPAGTLTTGGHILDGGYFENFGAATALELLRGIAAVAPNRKIIVIQISNDPLDSDPLRNGKLPGIEDETFAFNEVRAPIRGLLKTREARGMLAAKRLREWVAGQNEGRNGSNRHVYAHFRLQRPKKEDHLTIALGWVLSKVSECAMRVQLRSVEDNQKSYQDVLAALGTPGPEIERRLALAAAENGPCDGLSDQIHRWSFAKGK